jgi:transglutaminase-like putative cysteine protease
MSPGDITNLGLSDDVAFRVEFLAPPPDSADLYWRGPVLTNFNGRTWTRDRGMRSRPSRTVQFMGTPSVYRVSLEPTDQPWLFALDMPQSWTSGSRRRTIVMGSDYQLRSFTAGGRSGGFQYQVTSYTRYAAREPLTQNQLRAFTRLPEERNPRTRALARSWLRDNPSPRAIVERAMDFLRSEEFFYTLTPPPLGLDTADEFLFATREGFCEHYASAFTIMLRAAGVPARVVTGYQGGELNPLGQYYIVRQSDAHAWTEVWFDDDGWVRVDPITAVAPERIAMGSLDSVISRRASTGTLGRFAFIRTVVLGWDAVSTFWDRYIIGYSAQLQRGLLERLGFDQPSVANLLSATILTTLALMLMLTAYLTVRFRSERHRDPAASCYARFVRYMRRCNVVPHAPGETPTAFGERAAAALPGSAGEIRAIVSTYLAARYEPDSDLAALRRLRDLVDSFRPKSAPGSR